MSLDREPFDPRQVRALLRGDGAAREAFFEHYYDRVYGYLVQSVRQVALAEDLTQEAFLRMAKALHRLDGRRDPTPWVFTVAANVLRDHWRRDKAGMVAALDELAPLADPDHAAADEQLVRQEDGARLHRAMAALGEKDRELLVLRAWEGLATAQLCEVLDSTPDAIRQRWSRAVRRLGEHYRQLEQREGGGA